MKDNFFAFVALCGLSLATLSGCGCSGQPKLVLLVAVDGLRADLLDRYDPVFQDGFRRLRDHGKRFENAVVDHGITVSHAGHVTLATGNFPSHHGIVDAAFYVPDADTRRLVDAVDDTSETIVGVSGSRGASPSKVLCEGLGEWIAKADPEAKSLAVGSGYVSSLLYSFHSPSEVYWYMGSEGKYVTSTFYRSRYPEWVTRFNNHDLPGYINASRAWECSVPASARNLAREDYASYEADHVHTTFPHIYEEELGKATPGSRSALKRWLAWTPFLDGATLALAKQGIEKLSLGQRRTTDYVAVVLSQVDNASHYYGPLSLETLDVLMRLDRELGEFFRFLDEKIGAGQYVLALSSDHGFPNVPEYQQEIGKPGSRVTEVEINGLLDEVNVLLKDSSVFSKEVALRVAEVAERYGFVAEAYTPEELLAGNNSADEFLRLYKNSYREDRVPRLPLFSLTTFHSAVGKAGAMLRLKEGAMIDLDVAIHGSPYFYDRRVPIIFFGAGVHPGFSNVAVRTVDVAPTLAQLAGIPIPANIDGRALIDEVDK